jgi:hypothetical protein
VDTSAFIVTDVGETSYKPTSGPRRQESVLGYNFRLAGHPKKSADREAPGNTLSG